MRRIRLLISSERSALSSGLLRQGRAVEPGVYGSVFVIASSLIFRYRDVAAWKTFTLTAIILPSPSADFETTPASSAYSVPQTTFRTYVNGSSFSTTPPPSR